MSTDQQVDDGYVPDGRVRIGQLNVRSGDQRIGVHAAAIVDGLRRGDFDVVDVALLDDSRVDVLTVRATADHVELPETRTQRGTQ